MSIAPLTSEEIADATDAILAEGGMFATSPMEIRGTSYERVFDLSALSLREVLASRAAQNAEATLIVYEDERLTTGEVWARSMRFASWLHARGVGPGDRVAIAMRNYPEWFVAYLGGLSCGACVVPLNAWWRPEELRRGLERSGAEIVVADAKRAAAMESCRAELGLTIVAAREEVPGADHDLGAIVSDEAIPADLPPVRIDPESDFALMFTSGSTGEPKGALLTHRGVVSAILSWAFQLEMLTRLRPEHEFTPPGAASLLALPLFHVTASHAVVLLSFLTGRKIVMMYRWDAREAARLIREEAVTNFTGVPTMTAELVEAAEPGDLATLTEIGTGGAKRPESQRARQREAYPDIAASSGYGLTETNALGTHVTLSDYDLRPSSTGRALPPVTRIEAFSEAGKRVARGETGELCIHSPANFRGYVADEAATRAAFHEGGWFRTGDVGTVDEDGFVFIVDRLKDLIIRGGENVSCLEVENALLAQDGVDEASAFSVPDEKLGERVGAVVWSREGGLDAEAVRTGAASLLAPFKAPERLWVSPVPLPRGDTGKTDKRAIQKAALGTPPTSSA